MDIYMTNIVKGYTDKDLPSAIKRNNEIMIDSKEYIAVNNISYEWPLTNFFSFFPWRVRPEREHMINFASRHKLDINQLMKKKR
jgi:hypothetical protein